MDIVKNRLKDKFRSWTVICPYYRKLNLDWPVFLNFFVCFCFVRINAVILNYYFIPSSKNNVLQNNLLYRMSCYYNEICANC